MFILMIMDIDPLFIYDNDMWFWYVNLPKEYHNFVLKEW